VSFVSVLDNFSIRTQGEAGNLCWAAVGQGIATYFDHQAKSAVRWASLCAFAEAVLGQHFGTPPEELRCCEDQRILDPDCDQLLDFRDALDVMGNRGNALNLPAGFDRVKAEIDLNCPIGVEIQSSAGNHIIALFGYDETNGQRVMVADPAPGAFLNSLVLYEELVNNYRQAGGKWARTYCTVANAS